MIEGREADLRELLLLIDFGECGSGGSVAWILNFWLMPITY
jgi:hypothetical protein